MDSKYEECIRLWDDIFQKAGSKLPEKIETGSEGFDRGLQWLTKDVQSVIDFGCGTGTALFLCNKYGTQMHIGIDLSAQAIKNAADKAKMVKTGKFDFLCGGVEKLKQIQSETIEAAILSNIMDNLYPDDAICVLEEIYRILKKDGKLLVKLNPFITAEQIEEYGLKRIVGNLFDDGMLLWNNTKEEWDDIFALKYSITSYEEIYYEGHEQSQRMYLLTKRMET